MPFQAKRQLLEDKLARFARSIWLAPADLKVATLENRLQAVYLPMWLVDAQVQAKWQAEIGFDYEVFSHQEAYSDDQWQTQRVTKKQIRWEPCLGKLNRAYDNQPAPALEEHKIIEEFIGRFNFDLDIAKPYQSVALDGAIVRLPNRPLEDAWTDAALELRITASHDCRLACRAEHIRAFRWSARFTNQHWSQLLIPLYTTYYLDDDNQPQIVLLHGQTGRLYGTRRFSLKQATILSKYLLAFAILLLSAFLLLMVWGFRVDAQAFGGATLMGVLIAIVLGTAVYLPFYTRYTNKVATKPKRLF